MTNLILEAINSDEVNKINIIKKNKAFLKKLINDLQEVYKIYFENEDYPNYSVFRVRRFADSDARSFLKFIAEDNCCKLYCYLEIVTYEKWKWLTDKYNTCKSIDKYFDKSKGDIEIVIQFTEESENLTDIIKDIIKIINHFEIAKRF